MKTKYSYYPGCTLFSKAKSFEDTAKACAKALDIELAEVPDWTCCGSTFPLVTDNIMQLVAPVRNLAYSRKESKNLTTLCAFCYNVLKRTNVRIKQDLESQKKINDFLEDDIEKPYEGEVEVFHFLEILKDINLDGQIKKKLKGLKVAPHYGCMLLRPSEEIELDDPEDPSILENLLNKLGAEVIDFPYRLECCGSYLVMSSSDVATSCSYKILNSALKHGAEALITSCPLCYYNYDQRQKEMKIKPIPIFYFTELLAISLGKADKINFDEHFIDPKPLLKEKKLIT